MKERKITMSLDELMGDRFGRYSKYIIQDRALPDVRDGLKPVQRRILYSMYEEGNVYSKPYRKSAKTVGNVIGNYHPHGDTSVYDAMVRLSQPWKMRMPLIDMQGNNGSIDNDPAAAMRYTEARLSKIAGELLKDIDKDTVKMSLNFDDTEYEPTVLPAQFPNLLVNGATGISAGYATDIPPHNLGEIIDATIYRLNHPNCSCDQLLEFIKGPDFPTGAVVEGKEGITKALKTGKGKVIVRAKSEIVEEKNINKIVISEIPYEVNKAELVRKLDEIRYSKNIDGIIEVRDESDRNGLSIVIDLKKDVNVENTLNYFYKNTDLQKNYNYNMVAIKDRKPMLMGVEEILDGYIDHQKEVITRRSHYDLNKAKDRLHIVEGLIKAVSILDEVVKTIRASKDKADAKKNLQNSYGFSEKQAEAIVTLQLYRLTNTDIVALQKESTQLNETINTLQNILDHETELNKVIIKQLKQIKKDYPSPRLTEIKDEVRDTTINEEEMILPEEIYVTLTRDGYIKRVSSRSYNASDFNQFGKKEEDELIDVYQANTLDKLLVFTNRGRYMFIPIHKLEENKWKDVGKHISYLIKIDNDEKIVSSMLIKDFNKPLYVILASIQGQIKRVALKDFEVVRYSKPIKCMNLKENDELVGASLSDGRQNIIMTTKKGYAVKFSENDLSIIGIKAGGVKGINCKDDEVVSLNVYDANDNDNFMIITNQRSLKRLHMNDIPVSKRAIKGTKLFKNYKTKDTTVLTSYVCPIHQSFRIYDQDNNCITFEPKDYNYQSLTAHPVSIKGLTNDIHYIYNDNVLSSADYDETFQEENKPEINNKKEEKPAKLKNQEENYEFISFDDLFKDDF